MSESTSKVAIVFALQEELKPLLKEAAVESRSLGKPAVITKAGYHGIPVIFCQTGVGMANAHQAAEHLFRRFRPSLIVSAGCAGSTQPDLGPGDFVLCSEILSETPSDRFETNAAIRNELERLLREEDLPYRTGPLATVWAMAGPEKKAEMNARGASALDMETAAVAAIAAKEGVPLVSLRVIFDPMDEKIPCKEPFDEDHPISFLFKNPGMILKIPKYARWSRLCQNRLARILGRFIDCYGRPGGSPLQGISH